MNDMIWQVDNFCQFFLIIFIHRFVLIIGHRKPSDRKRRIVQLFIVCFIFTFSILCLLTKSLCFKNSTLILRRLAHQFSFKIHLPKFSDKKLMTKCLYSVISLFLNLIIQFQASMMDDWVITIFFYQNLNFKLR